MAFAPNTKVPVAQSRSEIETLLKKYGADGFLYFDDGAEKTATIMFRANGRHVKFIMPVPDSPQEERSRWRSLRMCVYSKLDSVENGIETFEQAFMAHVVLPDGRTMSEWIGPQLIAAYSSGSMPRSLLALPAPDPA
jgi:hypothetical protein